MGCRLSAPPPGLIIKRKPRNVALITLLQPERGPRNVDTSFEPTAFPIIPDFHRHGFPAAGTTRTAARPLAFRIRSRQNRPLYRSGPRLRQSLVRRHRPHRLDDPGLSLSGGWCLQAIRHLHEALRNRPAFAECLDVGA